MKDSIVSVPLNYGEMRAERVWPLVAVTLYAPGEIQRRQVGYRFDASGRTLVQEDGWQAEWIVIGHEELCGDPIFIDVSKLDLPVFTATHGEGSWDAVPISRSLKALLETMDVCECVREGNLDLESGLAKIGDSNADEEIDLEFWSVLMEP